MKYVVLVDHVVKNSRF